MITGEGIFVPTGERKSMTKAVNPKAAKPQADFTKGPFLKKIIVFAIPLILTGVLQSLYNAADLIVVGQFSDNSKIALAAIGNTGALTNLVVGLFMGLSVGSGVCVAHHVGARE